MRARPKFVLTALAALAVVGPCLLSSSASGQENPSDVHSPGADGHAVVQPSVKPNPQSSNSREESDVTKGTRVFGVIPNELTVVGATVVKPLSTGEKFKLVSQGAFDPYEFSIVGVLAGIGQATNNTPEWGQGAKGYGIRYGTNLGNLVIGNYMVGAVFPTIFRQDPRYFQLGKGGFWHRTAYALSQIVITQGDSGKREFNVSEIGGNAMAGVLSNTYHPPEQRSFEQTSQTWATQLAVDAIGFELKEFWPDIRRRILKRKK